MLRRTVKSHNRTSGKKENRR